MGNGPGDLYQHADELLFVCVDALNTIPTYEPTLDGAPDRYFVAPGQPAADCCPQLTVHVGPIGEFFSSAPPPKASDARINRVQFIATLFRCVPTLTAGGNPPDLHDQAAAAEQIDADGWALWNHVWNLVRNGTLFARCNPFVQSMTPLVPSGGCGGWILTVSAHIDGYEETSGT